MDHSRRTEMVVREPSQVDGILRDCTMPGSQCQGRALAGGGQQSSARHALALEGAAQRGDGGRPAPIFRVCWYPHRPPTSGSHPANAGQMACTRPACAVAEGRPSPRQCEILKAGSPPGPSGRPLEQREGAHGEPGAGAAIPTRGNKEPGCVASLPR